MKKRRRYAGQRRSPSRRWHIPPPLIHGPEPLEGGGILQEWPEERGVVLWAAFRDTMLWAVSAPEDRGEIFRGQSPRPMPLERVEDEDEAKLYEALKVLDQLVANATEIPEDHVSRACRQVSEWAEGEGRLVTALAFAQNAALAARDSAPAAFWVATIAGRLNDHARAEVWFRRAIGLARQSRDWRMYSRAFSGLGNLYIRRGNLPAARRLHTRALRGARRGGMRREQAYALHDLFGLAVELGNGSEAERLARQALETYGTRNRRVHVLAHDVAYFWMEQGHFQRALAVFQAVLPLIDRPLERLFVLADTVRAAGGVGDTELAGRAAADVWRQTQDPELEPGAARALLEVARGYFSLELFDDAEAAARASHTAAVENRESKVSFAAESLLHTLEERSAAPRPTREVAPVTSDGTGDQLAADFVRTLEVIAGAAH